MTLKRARRSAQAIANRSAATQPKFLAACRLATYSTSAGATPKSTKSASKSSSAPKREVPFKARAIRPSRPSSTAARGDRAHRPFDRPLHRQTDRGQAKAEREQRDEVGDQEPERHSPETATPRRRRVCDRRPGRGAGLVHASAPLKGRRLDSRPRPARSPSRRRRRANRRRPRCARPAAGRRRRASRSG